MKMPRWGMVASASKSGRARACLAFCPGGRAAAVASRLQERRQIYAGVFEQGNQTGDGLCLVGDNFVDGAAFVRRLKRRGCRRAEVGHASR